ncbi:uncharacterized protein I303_105248 [Kwoniella dejecticola CBS 10117]|uniref:chitin deacetylase n=1 Tax=Kwoniella dejecticola CBS 10117 TaxID=1296121 RepID=A0A1A6A310_9TREE|nr:uncharacterized protein I303_05304 [Kwoniella dejecticola CBS 10117]OBR84446.1 hypothetical protein I303_05304 [Kwoniella dejecticola CBS 10117]
MFSSNLLALTSLLAVAVQATPLDESWLQPRDSPVHALFSKRAPSPDDPNFASNYPAAGSTPGSDKLPQAWIDKLNSINLPNVSVSNPNNGYPTYADGETPSDQHICSFTYECVTDDDLHDAPSGIFALSFDDGPSNVSPDLYAFLATNNISTAATHFMIGGNILYDPKGMQAAVNAGGHIAVHTWSHQYTTTLSNEGVLGELGWTMQIISDLNGGRIPRYWRPPYGDVDNRVRAIAKQVFGLETVVWNTDSADWAIGGDPSYTHDGVVSQVNQWLTGSKDKGLVLLEHESKQTTVDVFKAIFPSIISNGWTIKNVADAFSMDWYVNSGKTNTEAITTMSVGSGPNTLAVTNSSSSQSSASASASASVSGSITSAAVSASTTSAGAAQSSGTGVNTAANAAQSSNPASSASQKAIPGYIVAGLGLFAALLF